MVKCSRFLKCDAPICPEDNPKNKIWYPTEAICSNPEYSQLQYIITQKKIKKRAKEVEYPFTFKMLNRNIIIKSGIIGIDPNRAIESQEERWCRLHPPIKPMSAERKEKVAKLFAKHRKLGKKTRSTRGK